MHLRHRVVVRAGLFMALGASGACSSWRSNSGALTQNLAPRAQVEIWVAGRGTVVHAVRVVRDTLIAVPFWQPPACDSCAMRVPVAQVDSVRTRQPAPGRTIALAAVLAAIVIVAVVVVEGLSRLNP